MPLKHAITYANTHVYELDLATTYAVTDRFDLTMDIQIQNGEGFSGYAPIALYHVADKGVAFGHSPIRIPIWRPSQIGN